jgi:hypothetical protein
MFIILNKLSGLKTVININPTNFSITMHKMRGAESVNAETCKSILSKHLVVYKISSKSSTVVDIGVILLFVTQILVEKR